MSDETDKLTLPKSRCLNPHRLKVSVSVPAFSVNLLHTAPRVSTQVDGFPIVSQQSFPAYSREDYIYNTTTGTGNTPVFRYNPANAPDLSWPTPEGNRYSMLGLTITQSSAVTNIINVITLQLICAAPRPKFRRYIELRDYKAGNPNGLGTRNISHNKTRYGTFDAIGYGQTVGFNKGYGSGADRVALTQWAKKLQLQEGDRVFHYTYPWIGSTYPDYTDSGWGPDDTYWWTVIASNVNDGNYNIPYQGLSVTGIQDSGHSYAPRTGPLVSYLNFGEWARFAGLWYPLTVGTNDIVDIFAGSPPENTSYGYASIGKATNSITFTQGTNVVTYGVGTEICTIQTRKTATGETQYSIQEVGRYPTYTNYTKPSAASGVPFTWNGSTDVFPNSFTFQSNGSWSPSTATFSLEYAVLNRGNVSTPKSQIFYDYTTGTYSTSLTTVQANLAASSEIADAFEKYDSGEISGVDPTFMPWPIYNLATSQFYARTGQAGLTGDNFEFNGSNLVKWEVVVGAWEHFEHVADNEDDYDFDATLSATWSKSLTHSIDYTQDTDFDFVFDMSINTSYGLSITQSVTAKVTIHAVTEDDY